MKFRVKYGNFLFMTIAFAALLALGYYEVAVKGRPLGFPVIVSAVFLAAAFVLFTVTFFTTALEVREAALVQTINLIVKRDRKEIPFAGVTRIYRKRNARPPPVYRYYVEGRLGDKTVAIDLSLYHNPKKALREVISRVDAAVVDREVRDELATKEKA
jgi:hypothetical protein